MLCFTGVSVQIDIIEKLDFFFLVLMVQRLIKEETNRDVMSL